MALHENRRYLASLPDLVACGSQHSRLRGGIQGAEISSWSDQTLIDRPTLLLRDTLRNPQACRHSRATFALGIGPYVDHDDRQCTSDPQIGTAPHL